MPVREMQGHLGLMKQGGVKGILFSFFEEGKSMFDGSHCLGDGDILTVYADAAREAVLWSGTVKFDRKTGCEPYPAEARMPEGSCGQKIGTSWIDHYHGLQEGADAAAWLEMFEKGRPATLRADAEELSFD